MAYVVDLIERHRPPSVISWSHTLSSDVEFTHDHDTGAEDVYLFEFSQLSLRLVLSLDHSRLFSSTVWDRDGSVRRRDLDSIRQDVRDILKSAYDGDRIPREEAVQVAILQALERIGEFVPQVLAGAAAAKRFTKGWAVDEISDWDDIVNNPYGLDVSTIRDTASDLLGLTPEQICAMIPSQWRVIHMESVIRPDLLKRFKRYQLSLANSLDDAGELRGKLPPHSKLQGRFKSSISRDDIIADMVHPRVTFHGTQLRLVRSIIRHGFLRPGNFVEGYKIASPRSGIVFNRGIYSSQSPVYAMSYASGNSEMTPIGLLPSMRLFVCATIMGRTCSKGNLVHGPLVEGYDAHFDGGFEYIIHDERAMLPCYVVHLDLGSQAAIRAIKEAQADPRRFQHDMDTQKSTKSHPRLKREVLMPGDAKRAQEARKAAAMKWFPYGFGPATGTQFVIEEIGEISDDEEEYGDWQAERQTFVKQDQNDRTASQSTARDQDTYQDFDENGDIVQNKKGLFVLYHIVK